MKVFPSRVDGCEKPVHDASLLNWFEVRFGEFLVSSHKSKKFPSSLWEFSPR